MATTEKPAATKTAAKKTAAKVAKVDLPAEIFDVEANIPLIHQVVVAQQAAARQGTHSTKRRGEVRGGGRKPYKQKGTGRARQGSTRAPQFAGGGVVHGPKPRDYDQRTPKKMKAAALRGALSDRARDDRIHVVDVAVGADDARRPRPPLAALASLSRAQQLPRRARAHRRGHLALAAQRARRCTSWPSTSSTPTTCSSPTTSSSPRAPTTLFVNGAADKTTEEAAK